MYRLVLYIHIASAIAYFLFHGAVASVTFALKRAVDDKQRRALSDMLDLSYRVSPLSLLTLLVSGIVLGFMGRWWSDAWIWISILTLVAIGILMFVVGGLYFARRFEGVDGQPWAPEIPNQSRTHRVVYSKFMDRHHAKIPALLTAIGLAAMALILWLMMFKPF